MDAATFWWLQQQHLMCLLGWRMCAVRPLVTGCNCPAAVRESNPLLIAVCSNPLAAPCNHDPQEHLRVPSPSPPYLFFCLLFLSLHTTFPCLLPNCEIQIWERMKQRPFLCTFISLPLQIPLPTSLLQSLSLYYDLLTPCKYPFSLPYYNPYLHLNTHTHRSAQRPHWLPTAGSGAATQSSCTACSKCTASRWTCWR